MTALLLAVRIANIALILVIVWRLWPALCRAFRTGHRRGLDPLWALVWGLVTNRLVFVIRDTIWHHESSGDTLETVIATIGYVFATAVLCGIIAVHRWYDD